MASKSTSQLACSAIDSHSDTLAGLSKSLWERPEEKYEEVFAHAILTDFLEKQGFSVQRSYHMATAFRAEYVPPQGDGGVVVAVMCEYDSLPEIGHACGHNLIAEAGVGAAIGIRAVLATDSSLKGRVVVLGTPAEEGGGGKIILLNAGTFNDIDFCMMVHPTRIDLMAGNFLAVAEVDVLYQGLESHASMAPWEGINALDAAVACYNNISQLRQQIKPTWRIHGIIVDGGTAPNIIPGSASLQYLVRAPTKSELEVLREAAVRCFEAAALSSNCKISYRWDVASEYSDILHCGPMAEMYQKHAEGFGVKFTEAKPDDGRGSTDAGNVSYVVPTIHPLFSIPTKVANHTKEFTAVAGSDLAQPPTIIAAKSMALTAIDLFADSELRERAKAEFQEKKRVGDNLN